MGIPSSFHRKARGSIPMRLNKTRGDTKRPASASPRASTSSTSSIAASRRAKQQKYSGFSSSSCSERQAAPPSRRSRHSVKGAAVAPRTARARGPAHARGRKICVFDRRVECLLERATRSALARRAPSPNCVRLALTPRVRYCTGMLATLLLCSSRVSHTGGILWCPLNGTATVQATTRLLATLPVHNADHPTGRACALGWRLIKTPTDRSELTAWHEQLRLATRVAGRSMLTAVDKQALCKIFDCTEFKDLSPKEKLRFLGYALLGYVMSNAPPRTPGLWLEFGVYTGTSMNMTADARRQADNGQVHGFDSFEGLPTAWTVDIDRSKGGSMRNRSAIAARQPPHRAKGKGGGSGTATGKVLTATGKVLTTHRPAGTFSLHGQLPSVRRNAVLHKGLFSDTLPAFLSSLPSSPHLEPVAWVNVDMDLYQGAIDVLRALHPRMVGGERGTVLHFHELLHASLPTTVFPKAEDNVLPPMDEAKALFDWMIENPCLVLELVPRHRGPREEAVAFHVLRASKRSTSCGGT